MSLGMTLGDRLGVALSESMCETMGERRRCPQLFERNRAADDRFVRVAVAVDAGHH